MSRNAPSQDPLETMRRHNPADPAELRAALGEDELGRALARAIELGAAPRQPVPPGDAYAHGLQPTAGRRGRGPLALLGGLAAAALVAVALLLGGAFSGGGSHPTYAAAAVAVAEANPRLLVTAPGWQVTDANEFEREEGETRFGDGSRSVSLNWYPARFYRRYLRDRADVSRPQRSRLFGRTATTVDYGRDDYATMLAPFGDVFVELRGQLGGRAAYDAVLHSLRRVDVDTWLAAMPAGVVGPEARARVVQRMLRGAPQPPGFDPAAVENEAAVLDHYALGVKVASALACGWAESWLAARRDGDAAAARQAVAAMAGSRHWPVLTRMEREVPGGWARNVWHFAGELEHGRLAQDFGAALVRPDGSGYRIGPAWASGLQCTARIRRVPFGPS